MNNNGIASGIASHLISRNGDIGGYWGIGILCKYSTRSWRGKCSASFGKGFVDGTDDFHVGGMKLTESGDTIRKIIGSKSFDRIEIRFIFKRLRNKEVRRLTHACEVIVLVSGQGRIGYSRQTTKCWSHDPEKELRRRQQFTL